MPFLFQERQEVEKKYRNSVSVVKGIETEIKNVHIEQKENFDLMVRGFGIGKRITKAVFSGKPYRSILDWVAQQRREFSSRAGKVLKSLPALSTILASAEVSFMEVETSPKRGPMQQARSATAPAEGRTKKMQLNKIMSETLHAPETSSLSRKPKADAPVSMSASTTTGFPGKPRKGTRSKKRENLPDEMRHSNMLPKLPKEKIRGFAGDKRDVSKPKRHVGTTVTYSPLKDSKEVKRKATAASFASPFVTNPSSTAVEAQADSETNEFSEEPTSMSGLPAWRKKPVSKGRPTTGNAKGQKGKPTKVRPLTTSGVSPAAVKKTRTTASRLEHLS
jgi:hypothetical protein